MKVMQDLDPSGVEQRRKRKLKRRVYRSKVYYNMWSPQFSSPSYTVTTITIRDPTSCGTLMGISPYGLTVHGCIDGYAYIARYNYTIQIIMVDTFMTDFHGRYCGWRWPQLITTPKWSHATIWIMLNNVEVYSNITVALSEQKIYCFLYCRVPHHSSQWLWDRECQFGDNPNCFQDGWEWLLHRAKELHVWAIYFEYCEFCLTSFVQLQLWWVLIHN